MKSKPAPLNPSSQSAGGTLADIIESHTKALTASELAALLNVSDASIYRLVAQGRITAIHIGTIMRFDPRMTADWLRARTLPVRKL